MSDPADVAATPSDDKGAGGLAHEDRLAAILGDPSLPDRDKRMAIQEALEDLQRERGDEMAASYEPLERRFFEALALLAEGGHDYDEPASHGEAEAPVVRRTDGI